MMLSINTIGLLIMIVWAGSAIYSMGKGEMARQGEVVMLCIMGSIDRLGDIVVALMKLMAGGGA